MSENRSGAGANPEGLVIQALDRYQRTMQGDEVALIVSLSTREMPGRAEQELVKQRLTRYMFSAQWLLAYTLRFLVDAGLGTSDVTVHVEPIMPADDPVAADESPSVRGLLVLSHGDQESHLDVSVGQEPVPLLRPSADDRFHEMPAPLRLDQLVAIPRGRLLELVQEPATELGAEPWFALRRTEARSEVHVALDDASLVPGRQARRLRRSGVLRFTEDGRVAAREVAYAIRPPREVGPLATEPAFDDTPMDLTVRRATGRLKIRVDAPSPLQPLRRRRLPIGDWPLGSEDTGPTVDSLSATATTVGVEDGNQERWFVKLFACGTPQAAQALRLHFADHASRMEKANKAARGDGSDRFAVDPIVVVPVMRARPGGSAEDASSRRASDAHPHETTERLSAWFGTEQDPASYVVVLAPLLQQAGWPETLPQPAYGGLGQLRPVAKMLASLHDAGFLHGDVKPANLCRYDDAYVLVDGDAVIAGGAVSPTNWWVDWKYASSLVREHRGGGGTRIDVYEHDRFGFALIVLTVVAGTGIVEYLLDADIRGQRRVDSHATVAKALTERFPAWPRLVDELAAPFRDQALQDRSWDGQEWLDRVIRAGEEDFNRSQAGLSPGPDSESVPLSVQAVENRHPFAVGVRELALRDGLPPPSQRIERIWDCLDDELLRQATAAERAARITCWVVPFLLTALLVLSVIQGR